MFYGLIKDFLQGAAEFKIAFTMGSECETRNSN